MTIARLALRGLPLLLLPVGALPAQGVNDDYRACNRLVDSRQDSIRARFEREATGADAGRSAFLRGCALMSREEWGKAADAFEAAVKADPRKAPYELWLGRSFGEQAQRANPFRQAMLARKTKSAFERAVALDADFLDGREALLQYALRAPSVMGGGRDKAELQAAEIGKRDARRGVMARIAIARDAKDQAGVVAGYERLVAGYPDTLAYHTNLVVSLETLGDYPRAWNALDRMTARFPNAALTRFVTGRLAATSGQQVERGTTALRGYLAAPAARGEPSHAAAHYQLGRLMEKSGDKGGARTEYGAALALDPKLEAARTGMSRVK